MRYMLLIHTEEARHEKMTEKEGALMMAAYGKFTAELEAAGARVASDRLRPTSAATTVRVRDGKVLTTDGPFAETKEQLGGYYIVEAKNLDEAIRWASKIPAANHGSVEVRPIWA